MCIASEFGARLLRPIRIELFEATRTHMALHAQPHDRLLAQSVPAATAAVPLNLQGLYKDPAHIRG